MARKIKGVVEKKESKPMTAQERIDYVLRSFKHYRDRYEEVRVRFVDYASKYGPSYTVESATEAIRLEYISTELNRVLQAYDKAREGVAEDDSASNLVSLATAVRQGLDEVTKQLLNDWLNANSTSYVHNAVQDNRRAGAATLVDILQHGILALTHE